jgi:secretion/DNA translocation related TadE-like protein
VNRLASDDGFASPLMVCLFVLAALLCIATADAANVVITRARVQTAADAGALAAAAAGWTREEDATEAARLVVEANGAVLESCECDRHAGRAVVTVSAPTRIRMLGVAPREVSARAEAELDLARLFRAS